MDSTDCSYNCCWSGVYCFPPKKKKNIHRYEVCWIVLDFSVLLFYMSIFYMSIFQARFSVTENFRSHLKKKCRTKELRQTKRLHADNVCSFGNLSITLLNLAL